MAVLQLEGESAQLRQVARLFANGDITRDDYRNIRTVMIEAFVADLDAAPQPVADLPGNDTLIPVELPVFVEAGRNATAAARSRAPMADESPMALLAIAGAGAMLLLVAAVALGLG